MRVLDALRALRARLGVLELPRRRLTIRFLEDLGILFLFRLNASKIENEL